MLGIRAALRSFAHRHALRHRLMWGFRADAPAQSGPELETRYLILVRAMRDGVSITDDRLRETLESMPAFANSRNGEFDPSLYQEVARLE